MKIKEAAENGLRYLAFESLFDGGNVGKVWDIVKNGDFVDAELMQKELTGKLVWCKQMKLEITNDFIMDLLVAEFGENECLDIEFDEDRIESLFTKTDLKIDAVTEQLNKNLKKMEWYLPTEFEVEF